MNDLYDGMFILGAIGVQIAVLLALIGVSKRSHDDGEDE
jgi:hypothetical protein